MSKPKWEPFRDPKKQLIIAKQTVPQTPHSLPSFEQNFKIYLRVKPVTSGHPRNDSLRITSNKEVEITPPYYSTEPDRTFQYEEVFGQAATNMQVFERTMREPIRNVLAGFNSTVFIYGMTGAGKTYTMFNAEAQYEGVVGLTLDRLFEEIRKDQQCESQVLLSFFEIYNENIKDLLTDCSQQLSIMEDPVKGVFINQLREVSVEGAQQGKAAILESLARRSNNATRNNEYSSRSHAILQFTIRRFHPQTQHNEVALVESKLFLIDLAGNQKAGQNENKRFVEGVNINKSLLTLGKCITILAEQKRPAFIPFRDSKLTRILKDSLGGNSKTVMIACVSPEARFYEETLNTLKYSTKARRIKNKGKGGNIRLINRRDVPHDTVNRCDTLDTEDQQEKLYILIGRLQNILEEKLRVQRMREQMQECYFENQAEINNGGNVEACSINMKEINELMPKLNQKHSLIQNSIDEQIKKFLLESSKIKDNIYRQEINSYKMKLKQQSKELEEMKKILSDQCGKSNQGINQENLKFNCNSSQIESHMNHNISQTLPHEPQPSLKTSTPTITQKVNHNNHILIHQSNGKSEGKKSEGKKKPNMDISTSKNSSNKENVFFHNDHKRANTPQSSMHSSKILANLSKIDNDKNRGEKKQLTKPTINITMDNIKLKSPSFKIQTKESKSHLQTMPKQSIQFMKDPREDFLGRLREMDKNMHRFSREQLKAMVDEFEFNNYEMNKMQMSMINKLKFMAKTNDRSLSKDPLIRKDRSMIK